MPNLDQSLATYLASRISISSFANVVESHSIKIKKTSKTRKNVNLFCY